MASGIFQNFVLAALAGQIDTDTDTFKVALVTADYVPDFDAHTHFDDVTDEVVGAGYTAGGEATAVTINNDTANDRSDYSFADVEWPDATITARAAVIYVDKGGVAADSPLVAYVDFGSNKSALAGLFTFATTSPLRFQR